RRLRARTGLRRCGTAAAGATGAGAGAGRRSRSHCLLADAEVALHARVRVTGQRAEIREGALLLEDHRERLALAGGEDLRHLPVDLEVVRGLALVHDLELDG